jgi:protein required for attachment to host cells
VNKTCIVVADAGLARFYGVEEVDSPRVKTKLVERVVLNNPDLRTLGTSVTGRPRTETNTNREAGPVHPMGAQRERHRVELERRFGQEIVRQVGEITKSWNEGVVVLVAEPQLLGLMRESLRKALHQGIELKELAKDYTSLPAHELHERLALSRFMPAH